MNTAEMKAWREAAGQTQTAIATMMGLGLRSYQDIEAAEGEVKARHVAALERASLRLAVEGKNLNIALPAVRRDALAYAELFTGLVGLTPPR